jgi:LuxR family maltose regulon positive regulatory protein
MARNTLYLLRFSLHEQRYIITNGSLELSLAITTSDHAWQTWLATISSFAFEDRAGGHYTIRKERLQRGDAYWYAYRSIQGHTKKRYLGRTADLTLSRLEEVGARFIEGEKKVIQSVPIHQQRQLNPNLKTSGVALLLETKLHPPQLLARLVERTRLRVQLDISLTHKLTLLLAPAGFGKTTLVNQWLATHSIQPARPTASWVSLDTGDNNPQRFWRYVMTACQRLLGQEQIAAGQAALSILTTAIHPPFDPPPIDLALTHLLNALAGPSSGGLLVLDDYHVISEPRIHETLAFFIDHLPTTIHVLLLSRAEPDLPLLRWSARGELYQLHGADLRFSSEETAIFLQQALPFSLSASALTQLDSSLEGWAAGLRLLSLTLSRWHTSQAVEQALLSLGAQADISSPHRSLLDYFVTEILEAQSEPIQLFLLYTSVLGRLCGPLCDTVTGSEGSQMQLEAVERAGLFLETLEGPGAWYRYHALFAEAMRREASRRLGEEMLRTLSLRASIWYEQEALLTEAIEASWQALDMERMASLIEQENEQSFAEPHAILQRLKQLPEAVLRAHPMLCHLFAVELRFPLELRFSGIPAEGFPPLSEAERLRIEALLQMAEEGWRRHGTPAWIGANWAFRALGTLLDQESFSSAINNAQQALVFLPQEGILDDRLKMYRSTCRLFAGMEKLRLGQIEAAQQLFLQAQDDNIPPGNKYLALDIFEMLGKSHLLQGELKLAKRYFVQALHAARELGDGEMTADALIDLAWLAFEWNDLSSVEQQIREALALAQPIHPQQQDLYDRATLLLALLQYVQGETTPALQQLTVLLSCSQRAWTRNSFWLRVHLCAWHGRLSLAIGDVQTVQKSLEVQAQSTKETSVTEHLGEEILRGRLWFAQGKVKDALQHFAYLLPIAQEHLHQYAALELHVLLALTHSALKQDQQAHYWLRQTLMQTVHEGYIRLFLNEGKPMAQLLRSLLPTLQYDTVLRSYVQTLLRAATRSAGSPHTSRSDSDGLLFEPLSKQEERVLQLLATGWSNQDIAREMIVSINTVKYHIKHIYQKLGVSNRLQASEAMRQRLS